MGTGHISAGPRLSTTRQHSSIRSPVNGHLYCRRCPHAASSDDLHGDVPPPYHSLPPLASIATRSTSSEGSPAVIPTRRRVQSESCASPYQGHDDDFLANLAAIQLLSGCSTVPERQFTTCRPCCDIGCSAISCALEDLNLNLLSKIASKIPAKSLTMPPENRRTLHGGTDGHASMDSSDRARMCAHCRPIPMTPPFPRKRFPSEDLDRKLKSIENALHRDSFQIGKANKRLHTSEVSRKEQSLTADDTVDVDNPRHEDSCIGKAPMRNTPRGILGVLRNLSRKDYSRHSDVTSPWLDSSEMPSPCKATSEVSRRV